MDQGVDQQFQNDAEITIINTDKITYLRKFSPMKKLLEKLKIDLSKVLTRSNIK